MPDRVSLLNGDLTWYLSGENNRSALSWTGSTSSTATRTWNEGYSAVQAAADDLAQMDNLVPLKADTPDIYRVINQAFVDDVTAEHLTGGSLFSDKWIDGSTEYILLIGMDSSYHNALVVWMLPKIWRGLKRVAAALTRMLGSSDGTVEAPPPPIR